MTPKSSGRTRTVAADCHRSGSDGIATRGPEGDERAADFAQHATGLHFGPGQIGVAWQSGLYEHAHQANHSTETVDDA